MQNRIDQLASGMPAVKPHSQTVEAVNTAAAAASNKLSNLSKKVEEQIAQHPLVSLSIGLAIGATLGWLIKRK